MTYCYVFKIKYFAFVIQECFIYCRIFFGSTAQRTKSNRITGNSINKSKLWYISTFYSTSIPFVASDVLLYSQSRTPFLISYQVFAKLIQLEIVNNIEGKNIK